MASRPGGLTLHMECVLPAPRSLVFRMHTEADRLARWWGPRGFTAPDIQLDVRVDGGYRIEMQPPSGGHFFLTGRFCRVDPPAHLAYSFVYEEPDPDDRETIVEIALRDWGESTELILEQGLFATKARLELHEQGWTETLDRLHDLLLTKRGDA